MNTAERMSADRKTNEAGFSRLDGLALVAVSVLLAAVLLPAVARPRIDSQAILCLRNIAQLNPRLRRAIQNA